MENKELRHNELVTMNRYITKCQIVNNEMTNNKINGKCFYTSSSNDNPSSQRRHK